MFTWLQNMMQKHHKWLFSILLVVIIVAFVFTIGNTGGVGSAARGDFRMDFYGFDLNSQRDMEALSTWTLISLELNRQRAGREEMEAAMMQRAVLLSLANKLGVPDPSGEKLARFIHRQPLFQDPETGRFSNKLYTDYLDTSATNPRIGEDTILTVILQDYRIEQVRHNLQGPGYTLPQQARIDLQGRNTKWDIALAGVDINAFDFEIDANEDALREFYAENDFRYEVPPRIEISYVEFPAADFLDQVGDPGEDSLQRHYEERRRHWPKADGGDGTDDPKPLAEIRDKVVESWREAQAARKAVDTANHFSVDVYEAHFAGDLLQEADSIRAFLAAQGKTTQTVEPFTRQNPPSNASLPRSALRQAADLNQRRFFSDGVATPDGAAVLFFEAEQPAYIPPFDEVRERVERDYRRAEQQRLYRERAEELRAKLQAAVDDDKSFTEAAEALGLKTRTPRPFTFGDMPRDLDFFVLSALQDMQVGEVSELIQGGENDWFIFLQKKTVPQYALDGEEVTNTLAQLQVFSARTTGQGIINEMIMIGRRDLERREF